ncbi:mitochondrial 30S ribosomal protein S13 [Mycena leptocephala]|nr:mitochondrial 30S ribosomal protein S13 [Mycena leptocephala]
MVYVLGVNCPTFALTQFYGIGNVTAERICARFQMHRTCKVRDLTPCKSQRWRLSCLHQKNPSLRPAIPPPHPTSSLPLEPTKNSPWSSGLTACAVKRRISSRSSFYIEAELKQEIRENIAHQKMIGSYVGRRHAMALPVRGQNTQNNAKTARKLNRVERYS